jgi:hypothetical protein
MRDYSPKRRTALVLSGVGASGAYHAGVVRALDESGVKVDLVVGSGAGAVAAAFAAVAGGAKLYGKGGFWDGVSWGSFYRLRASIRAALLLLGCLFAAFLMPLALALVFGLLFPVLLLMDAISPGLSAGLQAGMWASPAVLRVPYVVALATPGFLLSALFSAILLRVLLLERRRLGELFENVLDADPASRRLGAFLAEVSRGPTIPGKPATEVDLSRRFVALLSDNLGQPGFRELILRAADLDSGTVLPFVLLKDDHRKAFAAAHGRGPRSEVEGLTRAVDLRAPGYDALLFDALVTGLRPPGVAPVRRVTFPRRGIHAGETRRLADATLLVGCGISEALAAGAEQIVVATAVPERAGSSPRRRGLLALADGLAAALERQAVEVDLRTTERLNRVFETLLDEVDGETPTWQDPATGRRLQPVPVYVIRPERRGIGPLELGGARDPATEVVETVEDLLERGYRDAYALFVEPVVGATAEAGRTPRPAVQVEDGRVEL